MSDLREKVARGLAQQYPDGKDQYVAKEWRLYVDTADAAIAVCMEEARRAARNAYLNLSPEQRANGDILDDAVSAALRALRGEGGVDESR